MASLQTKSLCPKVKSLWEMRVILNLRSLSKGEESAISNLGNVTDIYVSIKNARKETINSCDKISTHLLHLSQSKRKSIFSPPWQYVIHKFDVFNEEKWEKKKEWKGSKSYHFSVNDQNNVRHFGESGKQNPIS